MENNEQNFIIPEQKVDDNQPTPVINNTKHSFSNVDFSSQDTNLNFNIKVIGIGGAGCNVINYIAANHNRIMQLAKVYAFNTDISSLKLMKNVDNLFLLNKEELKGYGSGGNPEVGQKAVKHDAEVIKKELAGTDILFIVAGMGKGAGSGGAPELASIAKDLGILTVAIVNMPSVACEGSTVYNNAFNYLQTLSGYADSVTTISNEKIISINKSFSFYDAYQLANQEIAAIIEDIVNIISLPSVMNIDFADLRSFFKRNKFFMASRVSIDINNIDLFKVKDALGNKIKQSLSDVNINDCQQIITNIVMDRKTPTTILADINKSLIDITHNNRLSLITGVDYNDSHNIDISYLIAGKSFTSNFDNAFKSDSDPLMNWSEPTVKLEPVNDSEANEYDNLLKDVEVATKPTEDVLAQNNQNEKEQTN